MIGSGHLAPEMELPVRTRLFTVRCNESFGKPTTP